MEGRVRSGDPRTHPSLTKRGGDPNPGPVASGWPPSLTVPVPLSGYSRLSVYLVLETQVLLLLFFLEWKTEAILSVYILGNFLMITHAPF